MATLIRNGNKIGFSSSDASLVNFVKSDGTRDTVQNEITSLNSAIANLQTTPTLVSSNVANNSIITVPSEYYKICLKVTNASGNSIYGYIEIPRAFITSDTMFPQNNSGRFWFNKQTDTTFKFTCSTTDALLTVYGIK